MPDPPVIHLPIMTSPSAVVSVMNPCSTSRSSAYQSLHASPIAPDCQLLSAESPFG
jgi:hypothetical protein